jgi:hypothetical protein
MEFGKVHPANTMFPFISRFHRKKKRKKRKEKKKKKKKKKQVLGYLLSSTFANRKGEG